MPFTPGDPNINRNGRPKGSRSLSSMLVEALKRYEETTNTKFEDLLIQRLLDKAISKGEIRAIREIFDRVDGKPAQSINLNSGDKLPDKVVVEIVNGHANPYRNKTE
jgi:hypothetical protein